MKLKRDAAVKRAITTVMECFVKTEYGITDAGGRNIQVHMSIPPNRVVDFLQFLMENGSTPESAIEQIKSMQQELLQKTAEREKQQTQGHQSALERWIEPLLLLPWLFWPILFVMTDDIPWWFILIFLGLGILTNLLLWEPQAGKAKEICSERELMQKSQGSIQADLEELAQLYQTSSWELLRKNPWQKQNIRIICLLLFMVGLLGYMVVRYFL